jgi:SnoaL-like domain
VDLTELAVRERVRDTYAAYNHAGDRFRLDDLASCFSAEGVLEIKGRSVARGRPAILELMSGARWEPADPTAEIPVIRHFVTNLLFTSVSSSRVESTAYFQVFTQAGPDHWGRYRDVLVPDGDRWLFEHRLVAVDSVVAGGWYDSNRS